MLSFLVVLTAACAIGVTQRDRVQWRWLVVAAALFVVHEIALDRFLLLPRDPIGTSRWNWTGKALAFLAMLAIAHLPAFGRLRTGWTLRQSENGRPMTWFAAALVTALIVGLAIAFPTRNATSDTLIYQLTMPGLDEELFFRGVFLLALNEAFIGRIRIGGISVGWGGLLSCALFALVHALQFKNGEIAFAATAFGGTFVPALLLLWFRERTGSLLLPIVLHNFGNSASYFF
ncbi:CPBP family intramembrane glutamic endopeptidase, BDIM_20840 family [Roseiterribacter gracilis]